jgi:hypothetical protein
MLDLTDQRLDACSSIAEALLGLWTMHALMAFDVGLCAPRAQVAMTGLMNCCKRRDPSLRSG